MLQSERVWLLPNGNRGIWLRCISTGLHVYVLHVQLPSEQLLVPPTGSRAIMWSRTSLKA